MQIVSRETLVARAVSPSQVLPLIERFLQSTGLTAPRFGLYACNDPSIIYDLRSGRELRQRTVDRIVKEIERRRPGFTQTFLGASDGQKENE